MNPRILSIEAAAAHLRGGKPAIFPTDTVYGLGVSVCHAADPAILFELKHRDGGKPVAWLVGSVDDLDVYGKAVPEFASALARTFWPGALTLIVKASDAVPAAFCSGEGTIGLRMPASETALALVRAVGCPIATTSANVSGEAAPARFSDLDERLLGVVGGAVRDDVEKSGVASTVIDCTHDHPEILRAGAITAADIRALS